MRGTFTGISSFTSTLDLSRVAEEHPLIACWLGLFLALALVLGGIHESKIFMKCLVLFIQELKHECADGLGVLRELGRELTTWKTKE
jgi:hypothetical protein